MALLNATDVRERYLRLRDEAGPEVTVVAATKYVPLEQLALSPQCGFSSTHHGNDITEDDQWRKLELVVDVAESVWG